MPTDAELLRQYVEAGSEAAFTELVRRYAGLVYSAALCLAGGNAHLAKEVTQDVFILLARKAPMLIHHETLIGWLYTTTRYVALGMIRKLRRRAAREQEVVAMQTNSAPEVPWEQLRPLLDEAVCRLAARDRDAVLLRYFHGKSYGEVGAALHLTENTARVRTERAVEKLRHYFAQSGVATTAALLTEALTVNAAQVAPPGLAAEVAAVAHAKGLSLGHIFLKTIYMTTKTKIVIAAAVILVVATLPVTVPYLRQSLAPASPPTSSAETAMATPSKKGLPAPASSVNPSVAPTQVQSAAFESAHAKVNPRAPSPGVYPNAPRLSDLRAASAANRVPMSLEDLARAGFGNFFQKMQFTPEQIAAFLKINVSASEAMAAAKGNRAFPPVEQMQSIMADAHAQMQQLLGDDGYAYLQDYNLDSPQRTIVADDYADALNAAGLPPLTLDQVEQLASVAYQYLDRNSLYAQGNYYMDDSGEHLTPDFVANALPPLYQQVLQQAGTFLSSSQVQVLQTILPNFASAPKGG